jgi:hypothetical protein
MAINFSSGEQTGPAQGFTKTGNSGLSLVGLNTLTIGGIPYEAQKVEISYQDLNINNQDVDWYIRVGSNTSTFTSGYRGAGHYYGGSTGAGTYTGYWGTYGRASRTYIQSGVITLVRNGVTDNEWVMFEKVNIGNNYLYSISGDIKMSGTQLNRVFITSTGNAFTGGTAWLSYWV